MVSFDQSSILGCLVGVFMSFWRVFKAFCLHFLVFPTGIIALATKPVCSFDFRYKINEPPQKPASTKKNSELKMRTVQQKKVSQKSQRCFQAPQNLLLPDETHRGRTSLCCTNLRYFYQNKNKSGVMSENGPKVIKIIVPEKRSHQKKRRFFQRKSPGLFSFFLSDKSQV